MSEGRKARIVLLHYKHLDMLIQPKLLTSELMEMTASHLMLREKDYFGLSYKDDGGNCHWLSLEKRVLDHDLPKNQKPFLLFFQVRLYVESICQLRDIVTVELFYLNARKSIAEEQLKCDSSTVFDLAAYVLQETCGSYTEDAVTRSDLKSLPLLPVGTLKEHPSLTFCEEQIIQRYKKLTGMSRGFAITNYMKVVESLPSYGIHFYEVKDKSGLPWWLGLSVKGITVYDFNDRFAPRKEYPWKLLLHLYYKDRKFSIQVHEMKSDGDCDRMSVARSRRSVGQQSQQGTSVQSWFCGSSQLTKSIWSVAVCQHQKYVELRTAKSNNKGETTLIRSLSEIAADLTHNSLNQTASNLSDCSSLSAISHSSGSNSKSELNEETTEAYRMAMQEMYSALKQRKDALEAQLLKKTKLLYQLCVQEAELTGFLPPDTPINSGDSLPIIRRRVGASFTLSPKVLERDICNIRKNGSISESDDVNQLEIDLEIQDKITQAALMLAKDKSIRRSIRKKRALSYQRASQKLKEMEAKLLEHQLLSAVRKDSTAAQSSVSDEHLSEDSRDVLDSETEVLSPLSSPFVTRHDLDILQMTSSAKMSDVETDESQTMTKPASKVAQSLSDQSLRAHNSRTAVESTASSPCSPVIEPGHGRQVTSSHDISSSPIPSPLIAQQRVRGYIASSVYSTRTQYRSQQYPTLCGTYPANRTTAGDESAAASSAGDNAYNLWSNRPYCYDSGDELKTPSPTVQRPGFFTGRKNISTDSGNVSVLPSSQSSGVNDSCQMKPEDGGSSAIPTAGLLDPTVLQCLNLYPSEMIASEIHALSVGRMKDGCAVSSGDAIKSIRGIPSVDVIRSTCHVVTSMSRSGCTSVHMKDNQLTVTSQHSRMIDDGDDADTSKSNIDGCETTVQKYHNYIEISKPFEMSDFYKYSERLRRQRLVSQMATHCSPVAPANQGVENEEDT